ncbi:cation-transporting P-type ATPase [Cryptosporangium sp. NPDC048952]|uniref:P-type ATPase n=1 Tax=Cryptosporangium sp. NPDC048952 TaxID=3363961 RepID=UPI003712E89A
MRPTVSPAPAETRGPVSVHPWAYPHEEVLRRFDVNPLTGLSMEEAARRRGALGPNVVEPGTEEAPALSQERWPRLRAFVDTLLSRRPEAETASAEVREQFMARVLRSDRVLTVHAVDLVPGDIVLLAQGDLIPADARLLDVVELRVDEEPLTGGELASSRCVAPVGSGWTPVADRRSMVHAGSRIVYGAGTAVVVATGPLTVIGRATLNRISSSQRNALGRARTARRPGGLGRRGGLGAGADRRAARATESAAPAGLPWLPSAAPPSRALPKPLLIETTAPEPTLPAVPVIGPRPLVLGSRPARAARSARRWTRSCGR